MPAEAPAPATRRAGVKVEFPFKAEENKRELLIASPQMDAKINESRVCRCAADNRGCSDPSPEPGSEGRGGGTANHLRETHHE